MDTSSRPQSEQRQTVEPIQKKRIIKLREGINKLPEKKPYLDLLAGALTIPLLLVTLVLNWNNLTGKNAGIKTTPTVSPAPTIVYKTIQSKTITPQAITTNPTPTIDQNACVKDIGPISISYPQEEQTISDNPVCIGINYQAGNYCAVVWAYQINGGQISDYGNNSVCLYNLPSGSNSFILHVKSLSSTSTQTLTRNFIYESANQTPTLLPSITPTITPIPSPTPTQ